MREFGERGVRHTVMSCVLRHSHDAIISRSERGNAIVVRRGGRKAVMLIARDRDLSTVLRFIS